MKQCAMKCFLCRYLNIYTLRNVLVQLFNAYAQTQVHSQVSVCMCSLVHCLRPSVMPEEILAMEKQNNKLSK